MQCKTAESDYLGDPGDCDVCGRPLRDEGFFCDAQLPAHGGRWGVLDLHGERRHPTRLG